MMKPATSLLVTILDMDQAPPCFVPPRFAIGKRYIATVRPCASGGEIQTDVDLVRRVLSFQKDGTALAAFERIAARLGVITPPLVTTAGNQIMSTLLDAMDEAFVSIAG